MAIDSQQKRMAAAGVGRPWMRATFPVASPTEAWRISVGNAYINALTAAAGRLMSSLAHHGGLAGPGGIAGEGGGLAG